MYSNFQDLISRIKKISKSYNISLNNDQIYNIIYTLNCINNLNIDYYYDTILISFISALRYHTKYVSSYSDEEYKFNRDYMNNKFIFILENPDILL
jgi:hypothetical protein